MGFSNVRALTGGWTAWIAGGGAVAKGDKPR
jgi:3-mercaptopyruvate sulfurtransferase SseA